MDSVGRVLKFAQCNKHVQESLDIIERAISTYGLEHTCVSFNGGKDCTAMLHLVHSVSQKLRTTNNNKYAIPAFYASLPNRFDEEDVFVKQAITNYNLNMLQYSEASLKDSLHKLKNDIPSIEAIFIGTRKDDLKPGSHQAHFMPTDKSWPKFMRVNPILDWSYRQVWDFIRELQVPYCDLYNQGYSSLGTKDNTSKNSSLLRYRDDGSAFYLPAWSLTKTHEERLSRSASLETANKVDLATRPDK